MTRLDRQDLFLLISSNLVTEELRNLRNYVAGDILAEGFVEKANAHEIFKQLEKENKLKLGDLSLLADILKKIGRHDYAKKAEQVAADEQEGASTSRKSKVTKDAKHTLLKKSKGC
ncbi:PREDICTED: uncharacterized protein LOC109468180 [Branchiostoma belcheri]|uniref:Uncharacterized protein LOC109468180 n=1 Tax=Branchiostoma belcheri TaxID=7741 RepID=A0A6P4XZB8_BRABE|nr:PREDICTED: uncharacterized protein LOC109468180 [Branchiostoma belcheri]